MARAGAAPVQLRIVKTNHYEIHTDLGGELLKDVSARLDAMYDEYARRLSDFPIPKQPKLWQVYLFSRQSDYDKLTRMKNTSGIFCADEKNPYLASFLGQQGREYMYQALQHQGFHQFAHYVLSPKLPTWLVEGVGELYADAIWTGSHFIIGEIYPSRIWLLNEQFKQRRLVSFETMFAMDQTTWTGLIKGDDANMYYNQAWGMVYFLTQGGKKPEEQTSEYLKEVHAGADPAATWTKLFPTSAQLESQFVDWATNVRPTPGGTLVERQEVIADMFLWADDHHLPFKSFTEFRGFVVASGLQFTYRLGGLKWKTDRPDVYFRNLNNEIWSEQQLYFETRPNAFADIVCVADPQVTLRTRYYHLLGGWEHELLFDIDPKRKAPLDLGGLHSGNGLKTLH